MRFALPSLRLHSWHLHPELRGDKQFTSRHTALFDSCADRFLIPVSSSGIDQTVSGIECVQHASLRLNRVDLIHTITKYRHYYTVIQSYVFHTNSSFVYHGCLLSN
jgi:hypothetical protein